MEEDPNKKISGRGFYIHKEHNIPQEELLKIWSKRKK